jgi:hypothetical protein
LALNPAFGPPKNQRLPMTSRQRRSLAPIDGNPAAFRQEGLR